jgi:hypothetical protein
MAKDDEDCKPPSEIDRPGASELGDRIEEIIRGDYCEKKGGCILWPFEGRQDFVDIRELGNKGLFLNYIKANNPHVDLDALERQFRVPKAENRIPDLITHQAGRHEFYEIKPDSDSSVRAGQGKVFFMESFCETNKLPYVPGIQYKGGSQVLSVDSLGIMQFTVRLRWELRQPGLIVYNICTERKKKEGLDPKSAIALGIALALLGLLGLRELSRGGGGLGPAPSPGL